MTRLPDDDTMFEQLLRHALPDASAPEIDANDLAALATGEVSAEERAAIEARLAAGPPADRDLAMALKDMRAPSVRSSPPVPMRRSAGAGWALAASLLLALGLFLVVRSGGSAPETLGDRELAAAFEQLHRAVPERLGDMGPLSAGTSVVPAPPRLRGGLVVSAPFGAYLATPEQARWTPVDGAAGYTLRVLDAEGDEPLRQQVEDAVIAWPPSVSWQPGQSYVLVVETEHAGLPLRGTTSFRVLGVEERARYQAIRQAIEGIEPKALRPIVAAHVAARMELLHEARTLLESADAEPSVAGLRRSLTARLGGRR